MQQVRSPLACRLAALIDDADHPATVVPIEERAAPIHVVLHTSAGQPSISQQSATPADVDELAIVRADAYAVGWTLRLLQDVATRLLECSNKGEMQHPGVAPKRVRAILPDHLKVQYMLVLRWLDAAHVLAPPVAVTDPFRHPRLITCSIAAELVARLVATPYPGHTNTLLDL
jgi:hypothetical protein